MPGPPVSGSAAIRNVIESFVAPAQEIDWENLAVAETGNKVLTERIDRFVIAGKRVELPVMGTFEFVGGKISAWRDYFDMATWQRQMAS
jgi:limonene-1,2-epoxide hydrolase